MSGDGRNAQRVDCPNKDMLEDASNICVVS
jgi:hypothetical protein